MDLEHYQSLAQQNHKAQKKFLDKLKRKKPKNLDHIANESHNQVFSRMNCLECANCCKTTGPLFIKNDIERLAKHFRMKNYEFEEKYLRKDEENDWVLQSTPCTFLNEDNTCFIYEIRPKACREFPHTNRKKLYQINKLTIQNTKICPAAYLVVEKLQEAIP